MTPPDPSRRLRADAWATLLADDGSLAEVPLAPQQVDPLAWPGYAERLDQVEGESVRLFDASCGGTPAVLIVFDFAVLGGSMGTVAGRRIRAGYQRALELDRPVVLVTCTGGARMQEGMHSLVQMIGVAAAAADHAEAGLLQVGVATDPTTGGVHASVLSICDVVLAERGAYVGFAGPRVAEAFGEAADERTPDQLLASGQVDAVVDTDALGDAVGRVLALAGAAGGWGRWARQLEVEPSTAGRSGLEDGDGPGPSSQASVGDETDPEIEDLSPWQAVTAARASDRPRTADYLAAFDDHVELVGDRAGGVDPHTTVALARLGDQRVVVVGQDHGAVRPAGYRTALRGMALAARLGLSVVTLIDTHGAAVDRDADRAGQGHAIAATLRALLSCPTPTLGIVIGEGGSGGAIALAATDALWMQRTATFSVIAPEGAAAILHRDAARASDVAAMLGLRAEDVCAAGIADRVIPDGVAPTVAAIGRWLTGGRMADVDARRARWVQIADGGAVALTTGRPDPR